MANLLVYEDNTAYWGELINCLSQRHNVSLVSKIEEAIDQLEINRYDMVVAAVREGNEAVFELLQRVRKALTSNSIPFVCLRGPQAAGGRALDEAYCMASLILGAKGYVAANDYNAVLPGLEQYLGSSI